MENIKVDRLMTGTLMREGAGVKLHRYIGADKNNAFDPILLFDYFDSSDPLDFMGGFPPHPHRGFETITYLLHGTIKHEDNKGHKGIIKSGDVQWMTAGKGIIHSEMPAASSGRLQGLQMWLNLPATKKMTEPAYHELLHTDLPLEKHDSGVIIKVIAGRTDEGTRSPLGDIATTPLFFDISMPAGTRVQQHILRDYQTILFVVSGEIKIAEQGIKHETLASLSPGDLLTLECAEDSQCLLIAAAKLHEPITRYGPFVMNTQKEVMQALEDFRSGRF